MPLYLEQSFPLGRFHATRWNQGAFGDIHGEWPPSPWRLLRGLAFRWFQWTRETGDEDKDRLNSLLNALASSPPDLFLPALTWQSIPIKQYLPTGLNEDYKYKKDPASKKNVLDYKYRAVGKSLNEDHFRAIPPDAKIHWCWPELEDIDVELLDSLLTRMLYFGRAESWTRIRRIEMLSKDCGILCKLEAEDNGDMAPVLAPISGEFDIDVLLAPTEHLKNVRIPPGTRWFYTKLPEVPRIQTLPNKQPKYPRDLLILQFAVGGHVFPTMDRWIVVTNRFRGRVLREVFKQMTGKRKIDYNALTHEQTDAVSLISGKGLDGRPLKNHPHAYFALLPDENNQPTRLIVWRDTPFTENEIEAFIAAAAIRKGITWDHNAPHWEVQIIPLSFDATRPIALKGDVSTVWRSLTPFVPPLGRKRFRKNGKERPGETPEMIATKLLDSQGLPTPRTIETLSVDCEWIEWNMTLQPSQRKSLWVTVHRSMRDRMKKSSPNERNVAPGYYLRLIFNDPVSGPITLGESSHFGLGLFIPEGKGDRQLEKYKRV